MCVWEIIVVSVWEIIVVRGCERGNMVSGCARETAVVSG